MGDSHTSSQQVRRRVAAHARSIRVAKSMTQETVAGNAGLAVRHLQKIEAAEVNVTLDTLVKVAAALGVDVAALLQRPADERGR